MSVLGEKVTCNACAGQGWRYPEDPYNPYAMYAANTSYPPPTVCPYCNGTGKREIVEAPKREA